MKHHPGHPLEVEETVRRRRFFAPLGIASIVWSESPLFAIASTPVSAGRGAVIVLLFDRLLLCLIPSPMSLLRIHMTLHNTDQVFFPYDELTSKDLGRSPELIW